MGFRDYLDKETQVRAAIKSRQQSERQRRTSQDNPYYYLDDSGYAVSIYGHKMTVNMRHHAHNEYRWADNKKPNSIEEAEREFIRQAQTRPRTYEEYRQKEPQRYTEPPRWIDRTPYKYQNEYLREYYEETGSERDKAISKARRDFKLTHEQTKHIFEHLDDPEDIRDKAYFTAKRLIRKNKRNGRIFAWSNVGLTVFVVLLSAIIDWEFLLLFIPQLGGSGLVLAYFANQKYELPTIPEDY